VSGCKWLGRTLSTDEFQSGCGLICFSNGGGGVCRGGEWGVFVVRALRMLLSSLVRGSLGNPMSA